MFRNRGGWFLGKRGEFGGGKKGGNSRKKMQTSQIPSENESMYKVLSKSDNGKVLKNRGNGFWGRGEFRRWGRGGKLRNKIQTSQIPSQNESK